MTNHSLFKFSLTWEYNFSSGMCKVGTVLPSLLSFVLGSVALNSFLLTSFTINILLALFHSVGDHTQPNHVFRNQYPLEYLIVKYLSLTPKISSNIGCKTDIIITVSLNFNLLIFNNNVWNEY